MTVIDCMNMEGIIHDWDNYHQIQILEFKVLLGLLVGQ